jgi:hypothetical protein
VGIVQRVRYVARNAQCVVNRELPFAREPAAKRSLFNEWHHVEQQPVRTSAVE